MLYTHKLNFDLSTVKPRQRITVVYGSRDTIGVEISLYDGDMPWNLPEGTSCVIRFMKANGNGGVYHYLTDGTEAWSISQNRISILLVPEALDISGLLDVSVVAVNNGRTLGIYGFDVHVESNLPLPLEETEDLLEFKTLSEINTAFAALQMKTDVDTTLSVEGQPADAAAVGTALEGKAPAGCGYGDKMTYYSGEDGTLDTVLDEILSGMVGYSTKQIQFYDPVNLYDGKFIGTLWKYTANNAILEAVTYVGFKAIKRKYGGKWYSWEWENPPMTLGKEYRTTERWRGKMIYTMLTEFGALPANGSTRVWNGASGVVNIIGIRGTLSSGTAVPFASGDHRIDLSANAGEIIIKTNYDASADTATVQFWYTKD